MKTLLCILVIVTGCASTDTALARRDAVRKFNGAGAVPVDTSTYRATEGVRGVTWGMTEDEVIAIRGEPVQRAAGLLMYSEAMGEIISPTVYAFFDGHLAQVKSRLENGATTFEQSLTEKYGAPSSAYDKSREINDAVAEMRALDVVSAVIGGLALVTGSHPHFYSFNTNRAAIEEARQMARLANAPRRDVLWLGEVTEVHFVALENGSSEITWSSMALGPQLVRQRAALAKNL